MWQPPFVYVYHTTDCAQRLNQFSCQQQTELALRKNRAQAPKQFREFFAILQALEKCCRMRTKSTIQTGLAEHIARLCSSRRARVWLVVLAVCALIVPATTEGLTPLSQGFSTTDKVSLGSIVSLQGNSADSVSAATTKNANSIVGVVINEGNSLLSLSSEGENQIQVATGGVLQVLVSDINGEISEGDQITASPIKGVGMKATSNAKVVGIAQAGISGNNGSKETYTDKAGKKQTILLGQVPVLVNVSYYFKQPDKTIVPSAIQNIANALAGKTVNTLPILISVGIFFVTLMVVVSIVYSMIHSSIISVGRNPMSQSAIYRGIVQLSALVVGILVVAVVSIYMILTRF
jgi:hypothetical protein